MVKYRRRRSMVLGGILFHIGSWVLRLPFFFVIFYFILFWVYSLLQYYIFGAPALKISRVRQMDFL